MNTKFNLNDINFMITFHFDSFAENKKYTLILRDLFHPDEKVVSKSKKYTAKYFIFKAYNTEDYLMEGIPNNIEYLQEFSEKVFSDAYVRYKYFNQEFRNFVNSNSDAIVDVKIIFERISLKKFIIHEITPLQNDEQYSKDL